MARKRDMPCAGCGVLLWRGAGNSMCRPCLGVVVIHSHGRGGYRRGCRCDTCRIAQNARKLVHYHSTKAYSPNRECSVCGVAFIALRHTTQTCSVDCSKAARRRNGANYRARKRHAFVESVQPSVIFERDGWRCHICNLKLSSKTKWPHRRTPTLDHVIPLTRGGLHEAANVQTACLSCNSAKRNNGGNEQLLLIG